MKQVLIHPMAALHRLGKRLRTTTSKVGLTLREFNAVPDLDAEDGQHRARAVFTFDENFTPEPPKDDEWERFQEEQAANEAKEREKAAREGLADLAKNLEGGRDQGIL